MVSKVNTWKLPVCSFLHWNAIFWKLGFTVFKTFSEVTHMGSVKRPVEVICCGSEVSIWFFDMLSEVAISSHGMVMFFIVGGFCVIITRSTVEFL